MLTDQILIETYENAIKDSFCTVKERHLIGLRAVAEAAALKRTNDSFCKGCWEYVVGPHGCPGPRNSKQLTYTVELMDPGPNSLDIIKSLREILSIPLKEAKNLFDLSFSNGNSSPIRLTTRTAFYDANAIWERFNSLGAKVEIIEDA